MQIWSPTNITFLCFIVIIIMFMVTCSLCFFITYTRIQNVAYQLDIKTIVYPLIQTTPLPLILPRGVVQM
jgi:hypothetical protein